MGRLKETILVTGGAGYVGSHVCKELSRQGFRPIVFDSLEAGHREAVKWGPLIKGNLSNARAIDNVFKKYKPKAVFHFAAKTLVGESVTKPSIYYRDNVTGTQNILDAMIKHRVEYGVFSSTAAVYGEPQTLPIPETHPKNPVNPYGITKWIVEQMLADFQRAYGLKWIALRYFCAAGADPEGELGEMHEPETHLIPNVFLTALGKKPALEIYGTDYKTKDGTAVRDFVHVTDLAKAHLLALSYLRKGGKPRAFNLGNRVGYTVKEVLTAAQGVTKGSIPYKKKPRRAGDPEALVADAKDALEILRWKPEHSSIESLLTTAWRWHQKRELS